MNLTKEQLQERIKQLESMLLQLTANYNAISGQKAECEYWLHQLNNPEPKPDEPVTH